MRNQPSTQDVRGLWRPEAGFTLIELLIAMVVMVEVMAAILLLFTSLSDIARVQTDTAEMQQAHRVGQRSMIEVVREAGLGGLPATAEGPPNNPLFPGVFPDGIALAVQNNVPAGTRIAGAASDTVLPGSDILSVRGVFSTPVYYFTPQVELRNANDALSFLDGPAEPYILSNETLTIPGQFDRNVQDLSLLEEALTMEPNRLLILRNLVSPGTYAVVETTGIDADIASCGGCLRIDIQLTTSTEADAYADLMAGSLATAGLDVQIGGPGRTVPFPSRFGAIGILDEYRFYVRPDPDFVVGDDDADHSLQLTNTNSRIPRFRLSRLSVRPGTGTAIGNPIDIADNLLDLQVVVGIDTSPPCPPSCSAADRLERGRITEDRTENDEVVFNHPADALVDFTRGAAGLPEIHFLRITSVVHAQRPERGYSATSLAFVEDSDRSQPLTINGVAFTYNESLKIYRRRVLSTVVDLRNVR